MFLNFTLVESKNMYKTYTYHFLHLGRWEVVSGLYRQLPNFLILLLSLTCHKCSRDNNSWTLMCWVSVLGILTHLIIKTTLQDRFYCNPHFTEGENRHKEFDLTCPRSHSLAGDWVGVKPCGLAPESALTCCLMREQLLIKGKCKVQNM